MVAGPWLDLWIDRDGWIVIAMVAAAAAMIFGGAPRSPILAILSYLMPPLLIVLFATLGRHG